MPYDLKIDPIFRDFIKAFSFGMFSLWSAGQEFFLQWAEQQPDMQLESRVASGSTIFIAPLVREIRGAELGGGTKGPLYTEQIRHYCALFCIAAFDTLRDDARYSTVKKDPVIEFFRHIRNGCAHGNRFTFKPWEPTATAKFKTLIIADHPLDKRMESKQVFHDFIGAGDIPHLINDVSEALETARIKT